MLNVTREEWGGWMGECSRLCQMFILFVDFCAHAVALAESFIYIFGAEFYHAKFIRKIWYSLLSILQFLKIWKHIPPRCHGFHFSQTFSMYFLRLKSYKVFKVKNWTLFIHLLYLGFNYSITLFALIPYMLIYVIYILTL